MFAANQLNEQNHKKEKLFRILFGFMTATLVLPVFIILTMLVVKGGPIISLDAQSSGGSSSLSSRSSKLRALIDG